LSKKNKTKYEEHKNMRINKLLATAKYRLSRHRYVAFVALATIALVLPHVVNAEGEEELREDINDPTQNYCKSAEKNAYWGKLLSQYKGDAMIVKLFALRTGLCAMIDAGAVTLSDAIDYYEQEKSKLLAERKKAPQINPKIKS
jgi:hypothetical protein